jgi:hypothetical protein
MDDKETLSDEYNTKHLKQYRAHGDPICHQNEKGGSGKKR